MSVDAGRGDKGGTEKVRSFVTFFRDGLPNVLHINCFWVICLLVSSFVPTDGQMDIESTLILVTVQIKEAKFQKSANRSHILSIYYHVILSTL